MHNVLWIEDDALYELDEQTAPVYASYKYNLVTATSITEGLDHIRKDGIEYDVMVVDIRLHPGNDPDWMRLYQEKKENSSIGVEFLQSLLKNPKARIPLANIPEWVTVNRIAVLTVESHMSEIMQDLGVKVYMVKRTPLPPRTLLKMIEDVLALQKLKGTPDKSL